MPTFKASPSKRIKEKQAELRRQVFGEIDQAKIWHRKTAKGFTTIPRTMPLIGQIMDSLSGKGKPLFTTYLELWSRTNDDGFVTLAKQHDIAFASGFSGARGVSTWKERIRKLESLGFISVAPGVSGSIHYAQLWNPYIVIQSHKKREAVGISNAMYNALFERALEIGAEDLTI